MLKAQLVFDQFTPPLVLLEENMTGVSNRTAAFSNGLDKPLTVVEVSAIEENYLVLLERARELYEEELYEDFDDDL